MKAAIHRLIKVRDDLIAEGKEQQADDIQLAIDVLFKEITGLDP